MSGYGREGEGKVFILVNSGFQGNGITFKKIGAKLFRVITKEKENTAEGK